jgi:hypothetical protein
LKAIEFEFECMPKPWLPTVFETTPPRVNARLMLPSLSREVYRLISAALSSDDLGSEVALVSVIELAYVVSCPDLPF